MIICPENKCTGCFACRSVCPKQAISSKIDKTGKLLPYIDTEKCIDCGLCRKVCPEINQVTKNRAEYSIASCQKENKDGLSASGGVASALSERIILEDGIVVGCSFSNKKVEHVVVEKLNGLKELKGSKYVYSENDQVFQKIKEFLENKKTVLYIGTPCQVAGLKNFLGKDYQNFYTVDLICHGVPPFSYLEEHVTKITKNRNWERVTFRGKKNFYLSVYNKEKVLYSRKSKEDLYFNAFLDGLTYRENCYTCQYATPERVADITLGDFWGLNRASLKTNIQGRISVILPNTKKGEELISKCKDNLLMENRPFEEAINEKQGNLLHPSKRHKERDSFLIDYEKYGFTKAVKRTDLGKQTKRRRVNNLLLKPFKKLINLAKRIVKKLLRKK